MLYKRHVQKLVCIACLSTAIMCITVLCATVYAGDGASNWSVSQSSSSTVVGREQLRKLFKKTVTTLALAMLGDAGIKMLGGRKNATSKLGKIADVVWNEVYCLFDFNIGMKGFTLTTPCNVYSISGEKIASTIGKRFFDILKNKKKSGEADKSSGSADNESGEGKPGKEQNSGYSPFAEDLNKSVIEDYYADRGDVSVAMRADAESVMDDQAKLISITSETPIKFELTMFSDFNSLYGNAGDRTNESLAMAALFASASVIPYNGDFYRAMPGNLKGIASHISVQQMALRDYVLGKLRRLRKYKENMDSFRITAGGLSSEFALEYPPDQIDLLAEIVYKYLQFTTVVNMTNNVLHKVMGLFSPSKGGA